MTRLGEVFYQGKDVVGISRALLGKYLMTQVNGIITGGSIIETEAYAGESDMASHAFGGRRTNRTEIMYHAGGVAYVYLCYGIHHLFNVVTNVQGIPHAVLIRAIQPEVGVDTIRSRRGMNEQSTKAIAGGPGTVSQALGITTADSGSDLRGDRIWIEDRGVDISTNSIIAGPRIGVAYAGKDAELPYRFRLKA